MTDEVKRHTLHRIPEGAVSIRIDVEARTVIVSDAEGLILSLHDAGPVVVESDKDLIALGNPEELAAN